ncbi:methyltransferase TYW3-domain-containing protein [Chaetomium fimeti]|uniref:tRNA(Phe) 7-[(3-amino-3-carboxypropyl)-4-demethylwyosine(37)-N(4)]-methyltransferase n=1 Tax=Chaetomium fimeti TaxID=1854472 RepID=A0AAE0HKQ7_9PEZI|nr:methyltransferase TYW3-domain-containing protein [Chaetomium fimeti]
MRFTHLLPLGLAAYVSAQSLASILANNNATLSTLTSLLALVPDVVQTLSTAKNITILAPSDTAFANLMARNPRSAELMRNPRALAGVLQYHVLMGRLLSSDFSPTPKFPSTLLKTPFTNVTDGQKVGLVMVNGTAKVFSGYKQVATVVTADVDFDGGNVVHIIDTVLTVPANPSQTAINTGLTSLAGALTAAGLVGGVNALTDVTIFAPSNDAFRTIGSALGTLAVQDLADILGYHVLARQQLRFSTDLLTADQMTLATLQGQNITVRRDGSQVFVNSAKVILADILTSNGVVHVLDNVLNPFNSSATPDTAAPTQAPAFSGVTAVSDAPFTSGISPTTTFVPATIPLNGGVPTFALKKRKILAHLAVPDAEYTDASPKGSVDAGIRQLIDRINNNRNGGDDDARAGLVTTSSCAGRVSVYLEGRKACCPPPPSSSGVDGGLVGGGDGGVGGGGGGASSAGGKGGGEWLFVSHDPVEGGGQDGDDGGGGEGYERLLLGLEPAAAVAGEEAGARQAALTGSSRLIHFKFEPMILHVLTASLEHAQLVIQAGMEAGFRESGAVSLLPRQPDEEVTPMVAVRSMGLSFESLIGAETDGVRQLVVSPQYLKTLVRIANERFVENEKRIARFSAALDAAFAPPKGKENWEDAQARKERKRLEGLKRREELKKDKSGVSGEAREDFIVQQPGDV